MAEASTVPFIVQQTGVTKGGARALAREIPIGKLRENLRRATDGLGEVFRDVTRVGRFELSEVTLGIEIGAEGGVHFIGTSKVQASASVTLRFSPAAGESATP